MTSEVRLFPETTKDTVLESQRFQEKVTIFYWTCKKTHFTDENDEHYFR